MRSKFGLVALTATATLMLFGSTTASAVSETTDKKNEKTAPAVVKPAPVIVEVQAGDTLSAIADSKQTSYIRLFNANDFITNPDVIDVGQKVRIPSTEEQLPDRVIVATPEVQAVVNNAAAAQSGSYPSKASTATVARGSSAGNTYGYGWCTWYAKQMRPDLPNQLGNGGQWVANARARGIATGTVPRVGAIAEQAGHVAYVEAVNGSQVTVSEMGYNYTSGTVTRRTVSASTFFGYIY